MIGFERAALVSTIDPITNSPAALITAIGLASL
jgi:hypothetical protein